MDSLSLGIHTDIQNAANHLCSCMLHRLPLPRQIFQHRGADPLRLCKQPLANIQLSPAPLQRLGVVQESENGLRCNLASQLFMYTANVSF